jgi:hypothetical protein
MFGNESGMPAGMAMLLKQLIGVSPEQVNEMVQSAKDTGLATIKHFDQRLQLVEARLAAIEINQVRVIEFLASIKTLLETSPQVSSEPVDNKPVQEKAVYGEVVLHG